MQKRDQRIKNLTGACAKKTKQMQRQWKTFEEWAERARRTQRQDSCIGTQKNACKKEQDDETRAVEDGIRCLANYMHAKILEWRGQWHVDDPVQSESRPWEDHELKRQND